MSAHAVNKIWMRAVDEKQVISLQWPIQSNGLSLLEPEILKEKGKKYR